MTEERETTREPGTVAAMDAAAWNGHGHYAHGVGCFWHGPAIQAICHGGSLTCPACFGPVRAVPAEDFWDGVRRSDKNIPGYELMLRWSEGKCFLEFQTLEEAWRQASTE